MMTLTSLGGRLKHCRAKCGLAQKELAERIEFNPMAVSRWERGEVRPRLGAAYRLAAALGCTVAWLLNGEGEGPLNNKGAAGTAPDSAR